MSDLRIYYSSLSAPHVISSNCSRWDDNNYGITMETWLTKSQLQILRNNITPGAAAELYTILGKPHNYDQTWNGTNTLKLSPNDSSDSNLKNMRNDKIIYVKNITTSPVGDTSYINVKIEGLVSGSSL